MNWHYLILDIDPHWIYDFEYHGSDYEDHGILTASKKMELNSQNVPHLLALDVQRLKFY